MMRNCDRPEIKHFDEEDETLYGAAPGKVFNLLEVQELMVLQAALTESSHTDNTLDRWMDMGPYRQIQTIKNLLRVEEVD